MATTAQARRQVERRLILNVVMRQRAIVLELLAVKHQTLLVREDALLVLDLGFQVGDRIRQLDFQCDGLARQPFHKDLQASATT